MKTITKRFAVAGVATVLAVSVFAGVKTLPKKTALAETQTMIASNYFYENLKFGNSDFALAKKFYKVFEEIEKKGDFKKGEVEYQLNGRDDDVEDVVTSAELAEYVNGNVNIPRAFGAARDAFLTDHPEIFYVDFYKLTISVMKKGGEYIGFVDSGREANVYYDNGGLNSETEVANAITVFDGKINEIVEAANAAEAEDTYSERDVFLAKYVNKYLAESIEYDYVAYENKDDPNAVVAAHINTAYGGLVNGKAVCGGYSRAYKVVMDKLEIPCLTVNGTSNNKNEQGNSNATSVYHMWNYVWLENPSGGTASAASKSDGQNGEWYSVDVTWNSAATNKNRYSVLSAASDAEQHVNDGVISSSGYELKYPELSPHNYGSTGDTDGLQNSIEYIPDESGQKDDFGNPLVSNYSTVSYNGKSAKKLLEEDNLYIVCRFAYYFEKQMIWTKWMALEPFREYAVLGIDSAEANIQDNGVETRFYDNTSVYYTQFGVFDIEPDVVNHVNSESLGIVKDFYFEYSDSNVNASTPIELGELQVNKSYGTYTPAPYIAYDEPTHQRKIYINDNMRDGKIKDRPIISANNALVFEVTYDEPLHILDESKPIGITAVAGRPNAGASDPSDPNYATKSAKEYAKFFPLRQEDGKDVYVELIEKEKNSGDSTKELNTIRFKFGPSLMWEHDDEVYTIVFTNVGSAKQIKKQDGAGGLIDTTSDKLPNPVNYNFARSFIACPACFNYDGRLWVECCAQPTLIANSDLSVDNFTEVDADGNVTSTFTENERSQMMLVAEKYDDKAENDIKNEIVASDNTDIKAEDIKKSETYDISLSMCGKVPKIPDGSYVRIALGFPEGYGPNDEGTTFKLFHRKHVGGDEYIIEEIPCVVTQYGIVATVKSFSPYTVAVVDADKVTDKTVLATVEGKGGKLSKADGEVKVVKESGSCTYAITPEEGYQVYSLKLNGKEVEKAKYAGGTLTLNYAELEVNNELEIQYIADAAAERYAAKVSEGYEVKVEPAKIYVQQGELYPVASSDAPVKSNGAVIAIVVVVVVLVLAAAVAVFIWFKKRGDKQPAAAAAQPAKPAKEVAAKQPAPAKQPAAKQPEKKAAAQPAKLPAAQPATKTAAQPTRLPTKSDTKPKSTLPVKKDK